MFWNHRVIQRIDDVGSPYEETNLYIVEVYYDNDGSVIGWTEKEDVFGHDIEELRTSLTWMIESLDKPILNEAELKKQAEEARENGEEDIFPEERLTMDEVLDSLGLEREDVEEPDFFDSFFEKQRGHVQENLEREQINQWEDDGGGK